MNPGRADPQPGAWAAAMRAASGWVLCAGLLGPGGPAHAQQPAERERIAVERRQAEATFSAAQAACQGRFLLTQCLDQAREQRRLVMDSLQRRQLEIDDRARRERSAERQQALQQRAAAAAAAASGAVPGPMAAPAPEPTPGLAPASILSSASASASAPVQLIARSRASAAPAIRPASAPAATLPAAGSAAPSAAAQRSQRSQADYQRRQNQAAAHRAAVAERNQRQDADRAPAAGLPVPAAP